MDILGRIKNFKSSDKKKKEKKEKEELKFIMNISDKLIVFPEIKNIKDFRINYPLLEPFSYVHIKWSKAEDGLVYRVNEPKLDDKEKKTYDLIRENLVEVVDVHLSSVKKMDKAFDYLEEKIKKILEELEVSVDNVSYNKIFYYIYRDFVGLNEIEPLMHDPYIEDISCDGLNIPIYVVHKKLGSIETNIMFNDSDRLRNFVVKLAERCGRYISYAEPLLDGSLPDGSRIQASLAEDVTTKGPTFSIRKFTSEPLSPIDLINLGTVSIDIMAYLWFCIESGVSMLICGGTATGKTTMLNAISLFIPPEYKIVSIEDTRELQLPHENWIPSVTRMGFGAMDIKGERYGGISMFDLLKESFRQNPDYVIVGEIRGREASVMFQGMASGHPSLGTMHAAGVSTVIKRLQSPPISLSPSLVEILDLVISLTHAKEKGESARRIKNVEEVESVDSSGMARTSSIFRWISSKDNYKKGEGNYVLNKITQLRGLSMDEVVREIKNREKILKWMVKNKIRHWKDVGKIVSNYHRDPEEVLKQMDSLEDTLDSLKNKKDKV